MGNGYDSEFNYAEPTKKNHHEKPSEYELSEESKEMKNKLSQACIRDEIERLNFTEEEHDILMNDKRFKWDCCTDENKHCEECNQLSCTKLTGLRIQELWKMSRRQYDKNVKNIYAKLESSTLLKDVAKWDASDKPAPEYYDDDMEKRDYEKNRQRFHATQRLRKAIRGEKVREREFWILKYNVQKRCWEILDGA